MELLRMMELTCIERYYKTEFTLHFFRITVQVLSGKIVSPLLFLCDAVTEEQFTPEIHLQGTYYYKRKAKYAE